MAESQAKHWENEPPPTTTEEIGEFLGFSENVTTKILSGEYPIDFDEIDNMTQDEFHAAFHDIERAHYIRQKTNVKVIGAELFDYNVNIHTVEDAAFIYQMASFMRVWAGSVRAEWIDIWNDDDSEIHSNTYDDRKADLHEIMSDLEATMLSQADRYTDKWKRAYYMNKFVINMNPHDRYSWFSTRMIYDMYTTAFMGE